VILSVRGTTLFVPSVAKVRDFYAETLALDITAEEDEMISFDVGGAMLCLDSRGERSRSAVGGSGFALWFKCEQFDSLVSRLEASGATMVRGPEKSTGTGKWFAVARDPAGNEVRIDEA
jgi:predicted enzyme related to lactoylglutathione lyase